MKWVFLFLTPNCIVYLKKTLPNTTSICFHDLIYIISLSLTNPTLLSPSDQYHPKYSQPPFSLFTRNCKNLLFCLWVHPQTLADCSDHRLRSQKLGFELRLNNTSLTCRAWTCKHALPLVWPHSKRIESNLPMWGRCDNRKFRGSVRKMCSTRSQEVD